MRDWEMSPVGPDDGMELRVTLSTKGEIMVGARAVDKLKCPDYAILMFDRENSTIGILPSFKHAKNAYPVVEKLKGRHRIIRASRFCRYYGIKVDRTRAFIRPRIEGDVLVLDLRETRVVSKK